MATKDFKVKNGLQVAENIVVNQNINVVGDIRSVDSAGVEKVIISTTGDFVGQYAGFDSDFNKVFLSVSTDSLSEGSLNYYYTTTRFDSDLSTKTTDDLTEGSNLYYTQARFDSAFGNKTTDDLLEATNLYYTDSRVLTYLTANSYAKVADIDSAISALIDAAPGQLDTLNELAAAINDDSDFAGTVTTLIGTKLSASDFVTYFDSNFGLKSTTDLVEGNNLYYTSARVDSDILSIVDSAYIQLRQADIFRDSGFVTGIIDSAYINTRVVIPDAGVDSASVTAIITDVVDSAYINARVDIAGGSGGATNLNDLLDVNTAGAVDGSILKYNGAQWVVGVDNTGSGGGGTGTVDSAQTIALITDTVDSAYISARVDVASSIYYLSDVAFENYKFVADSNQTIFTGTDAYGNTLALESDRFQVYVNGIRITQTDFTNTATTLTLAASVNNNDEVVVTAINQVSPNIAFTPGVDTFYFVATQDQTVFTGNDENGTTLSYSTGSIQAYLNGLLLIDSADYTATNGSTFTLVEGANAGDQLYIVSHIPSNIYTIQSLVDSAYINARVVIPDAGIDSASVTTIIDSAYINARVTIPQAYGDSDVLVLVDSAYVSSRIEADLIGEGQVSYFLYIADSGQSVFTGPDDNGAILSYGEGQIQLFLNGIALVDTLDYVATNGTSITLTQAADSGDQLVVNSFSTHFTPLPFNLAENVVSFYRYVATVGQTEFTGIDEFSNTLSYTPGNIAVYYNGSLLTNTLDYTASNGTSIVLTTGADSADEISIIDFNQKFIANVDSATVTGIIDSAYINDRVTIPPSYGDSDVLALVDSAYINSKIPSWQEVTANINVVAGQKLMVDTNNIVTITLPDSAYLGDEIRIIDGVGNASVNNITINRNNHRIQGNDSDLTVDIDRAAFSLVYYNVTNGWLFTEV